MLPESPGHPGSLAPCAIIDNLPHDLCGKVVDGNGEHVGFHPHCHVLCTDGCFYGKGVFRVAPRFDSKGLKAIFEHTVFRMLLSKGKITQHLVAMLRSWRHLGFQVYVGPRIQPGEEEATENLARYIIRAFFSPERMTYLQEESKVLYQSKDGKMEKTFDALEWLAAMTSHVPNKGEQMVSYYPVRRDDESHRRHRAAGGHPADSRPPGSPHRSAQLSRAA